MFMVMFLNNIRFWYDGSLVYVPNKKNIYWFNRQENQRYCIKIYSSEMFSPKETT